MKTKQNYGEKPTNETMSDRDETPAARGEEAESVGESDSEGGDSIYEMYCNLSDKEKERVGGLIQAHLHGAKKMPLKSNSQMEFKMMAKEDK